MRSQAELGNEIPRLFFLLALLHRAGRGEWKLLGIDARRSPAASRRGPARRASRPRGSSARRDRWPGRTTRSADRWRCGPPSSRRIARPASSPLRAAPNRSDRAWQRVAALRDGDDREAVGRHALGQLRAQQLRAGRQEIPERPGLVAHLARGHHAGPAGDGRLPQAAFVHPALEAAQALRLVEEPAQRRLVANEAEPLSPENITSVFSSSCSSFSSASSRPTSLSSRETIAAYVFCCGVQSLSAYWPRLSIS